MRQDLLIIVPAFNEEECIAGVVAEIRATVPSADVLVIDDGSIDATRTVALAAGAMVVSLPFNLGVGGALRTGLRFALRKGYPAVVQVDGDGQHDPREVERLAKGLSEADLIVGARFAGKGEYAMRGPRRWAAVLLARILSRIAGTHLTDVTSGFRAFGPRAIAFFAETLPTEYLGDTIDAIVVGSRAGLQVRQEPVAMRPRLGGTPSQSPLKAMIYLNRAMLTLVLATLRRETTPLIDVEAASTGGAE